MVLGRQRASVEGRRVEGGRVDEGNERGRDGTKHGQREGKRAGEGLSEEWSKGAREENFKGYILGRAMASIQYIHKPPHNAALAIDTCTLLIQMKNSEQV